MKNKLNIKAMLRIAGNLNRARSAKVPLLIIALAVIIGFSFTACDEDNGENGGGDGLTITNIPSKYNGKYVYLECGDGDNATITGATSFSGLEPTSLPRIANGKVTIPIWLYDNDYDNIKRYTGSHLFDEIEIYIYNKNDIKSNELAGLFFENVRFKNGSATKSFNDGDFEEYL